MAVLFGLLVLASMAGCDGMNSVKHDFCSLSKPIYLQKGEAARLSDSTARAILTHDETYSKVCGKPK